MSAFVGEVSRSPWRGWTPWLAAYVIFCLVVLAIVWHRASPESDSTDFRDFWENALHFRHTGQIASDLGVHNYLPFFTILMTPWSFLPLQPAAVLFVALSLALFALTVRMCEVLLAAPLPPSGGAHGGSRARSATLIAAALALPYVYACAVLGNVGLLLLFLVVACWFLSWRGHELAAGAALGLATLIKLLPAALVVYFVLRRQWRVAGAALVTMVVLGVGWPLLSLGPNRTWNEHVAFYQRAIHGHSAVTTILADKPIKANFSNNALPIVLRRLFSPVNGGKEGQALAVNIANVPRMAILGIYVALLAAIAILSILAAIRRPVGRTRLDGPAPAPADSWIFATWCSLMLLASPLVWTHYLPLAFWPLAMLADAATRAPETPTMQRPQARPRATNSAGVSSCTAADRAPPLARVALAAWLAATVLLVWPAARAAGAQLAGVLFVWLASAAYALASGRRTE